MADVAVASLETPIASVKRYLTEQEWEFNQSDDGSVSFGVANVPGDPVVAFTWFADSQVLMCTCAATVVSKRKHRKSIDEFLAEINLNTVCGSFEYHPEEQYITWRFGLPLPNGLQPAPAQLKHLLGCSVGYWEEMFGALELVLSGKIAPRIAAEMITNPSTNLQ